MNTKKTKENTYTGLLTKLLQGFVYKEDDKYWTELMLRQEAVRGYFSPLGLQLYCDEVDGYAFLKSEVNSESAAAEEEDAPQQSSNSSIPENTYRVMRRVPLGFDVSLLCVLIREALEHFDTQTSDDHRLILSADEIQDMLRQFFSETNDLVKQSRRFDTLISRVVELGFLKPLRNDPKKFEVKRPIKALIDAACIAQLKTAMLAHANSGGQTS